MNTTPEQQAWYDAAAAETASKIADDWASWFTDELGMPDHWTPLQCRQAIASLTDGESANTPERWISYFPRINAAAF